VKRLWAPWRMSYVAASGAPPAGCVLCEARAASDDRKALVLARRGRAFLILNAYPYASGHLMAVLNRHVGTLAEATAVAFPGLAGVLPGLGRQNPNDWGLGFELRDGKSPHWTGARNSPRTFGHFGRSGAFLWVDPDAGVALACLTDLEFGDWAKEVWPVLSDAVLAACGTPPS